MHLSSHKKAFKTGLLICNGHESFHNDITDFVENLFLIDPYHQKENYLQSLEIFKKYLANNNINNNTLKIIYGSGLEDKIDIKKYLDENFDICGNKLLKYTFLSNPYNLDNKLLEGDVVLPDISDKFHYKFLSKKNNSFGGLNVGNNFSSNEIYYQKYIPGKIFSVSFLSNKIDTQILGFNQLFLVRDNTQFPYLYAGAMTLGLDNNKLDNYKKWINKFSLLYKLNGFCSIDYKIYKNKIYIIDINPRLSGTYRLYKKIYENLMYHHVGLTSKKLLSINDDYHAYIILYAKNDIVIDESINNIEDIADTPVPGETFKKNMPVLTLNLKSNNKHKLMIKIKKRIKSAMKIIDCYNTQLEYE